MRTFARDLISPKIQYYLRFYNPDIYESFLAVLQKNFTISTQKFRNLESLEK